MGQRIAALCLQTEGAKLVGAFERKGHKDVGKDLGVLIGSAPLGITLRDNMQEAAQEAHVVVDFTHASSSLQHMRIAAGLGKAMVIGTTGFKEEELQELRSLAAQKVPCVQAFNMSLGVNLLLKVLADVARVLGRDYDIEILEAHHRFKKDAPSGTALRMAEAISEALDWPLQEVAQYARKGMIGERPRRQIGIQCIRAGDIVGEHTVIFGGLGERIEITHKASSRDTFARGALKAALWVKDKPPGLYDMQDVLGLK
jgi:4-hydroxy-tetrahydrodipicolinate reductase